MDLTIEGMVHAAIKTNPRQGGGLTSYNASVAKDMPGVQKVLEVSGGVAVIANNTWRAFKAVEAVECVWGEAPYPAEQADHWKAVEGSFTDAHLDLTWRDDGDVDIAFAQGRSFSAEYRSP